MEYLPLKGTQNQRFTHSKGKRIYSGISQRKNSLTNEGVRAHSIPGSFLGWCPDPKGEPLTANLRTDSNSVLLLGTFYTLVESERWMF